MPPFKAQSFLRSRNFFYVSELPLSVRLIEEIPACSPDLEKELEGVTQEALALFSPPSTGLGVKRSWETRTKGKNLSWGTLKL